MYPKIKTVMKQTNPIYLDVCIIRIMFYFPVYVFTENENAQFIFRDESFTLFPMWHQLSLLVSR